MMERSIAIVRPATNGDKECFYIAWLLCILRGDCICYDLRAEFIGCYVDLIFSGSGLCNDLLSGGTL